MQLFLLLQVTESAWHAVLCGRTVNFNFDQDIYFLSASNVSFMILVGLVKYNCLPCVR